MSYPQAPGVSRHTMERMSDNTSQAQSVAATGKRVRLRSDHLLSEAFYGAVGGRAGSVKRIAGRFALSPELAQLWVAEQIRKVSDSLVDRLAETALAHGESKSNVARAPGQVPPTRCGAFLGSRPMDRTSAR